MKNIFKLEAVLLASALALLPCCRTGDALPDIISEKAPVKIETRAAIGSAIDGILLSSVRVIAVSDGSGKVEFNRYRNALSGSLEFEEGDHGNDKAGNFIAEVLPGSYDFYIIVNEPSSQSDELDAVKTKSDLQAVKLSSTAISAADEGSMICVGEAAGVIVQDVAEGGDPAMVSIDGGTTWTNMLNVETRRIATKLTVKARKQTHENDTFSITGAVLSNVPEYSYLLPHEYDGELDEQVRVFTGNAAFSTNTEEYSEVFAGYMLPEYLMANPADNTYAVKLLLTADYSVAGGAPDEVVYSMLLLGKEVKSYNMVRNNHYIVNVSISERGKFEYTPYVEYEVAKWYKAADDQANVVIGDDLYTVYNEWAGGTILEDGGNTARVANNSSVAMRFTLTLPEMALWSAQLSNNMDFYFDEVEGVRGGVARQGLENRIVVRPRSEVYSSDVATELFITINNGTTEIEYDLNGDGSVGSGHRYVIKQIPN